MPQIPLNKKQIKEILAIIKSQWDADVDLDYAFFLSNKEKLYIVNKEMANYDLSSLRINSVGIYFGEYSNSELRLSIEGSQIVGGNAKKNVLELSDSDARKWLKGEELQIDADSKGFALIKNKNDFLGCGKLVGTKLINYVPKNRRIKSSD